MEPFHQYWQDQINRAYSSRVRFLNAMPQPAPLPWHRRWLGRLRYRIERARERLGEIIAGRRFSEWD